MSRRDFFYDDYLYENVSPRRNRNYYSENRYNDNNRYSPNQYNSAHSFKALDDYDNGKLYTTIKTKKLPYDMYVFKFYFTKNLFYQDFIL